MRGSFVPKIVTTLSAYNRRQFVIVYGIVQKYGVDGLTAATLMAGVILVAMGIAKVGAMIKFSPHPGWRLPFVRVRPAARETAAGQACRVGDFPNRGVRNHPKDSDDAVHAMGL